MAVETRYFVFCRIQFGFINIQVFDEYGHRSKQRSHIFKQPYMDICFSRLSM